MAKQNPESNDEVLNASTPKPEEKVSMSISELTALIARMTAESNERIAQSNESLAKAIIESRKPYVDPKNEENEKLFREQTREMERRKRDQILKSQEWCQHLAGSLGEFQDQGHRTAIVWHQTDIREQVGICTVCQKQFREGDKDYMFWRGKRSINKISKSGDRFVSTPQQTLELTR